MKTLLLLFATTLAAFSATVQPDVPRAFRSHEFNINAFAGGFTRDLKADPQYLGGVGLDYFVTRGLGFGLEAEGDIEGTGHLVDYAGARVVFRAPLWDRVAPYAVLRGGRLWDSETWTVGAGGGIDLRLLKKLPLSAYAEVTVENEVEDFGRSGLRGAVGVRFNFGGK